ncbi:MAG TPA: YkgJ family cysteine cluster protein [Bryobacteraceae bacterium]|nr:YkgJ family cysteine cluster protein [Bryobacteraceae bacterium]
MITDLVQIRRLGEQKRAENERFRRHLKTHSYADRRVRRVAEEVESGIDCTSCANCCRVASVVLQERDVARLSKYLGVRPDIFIREYTQSSAEEGLVLRKGENGCVFLDGTACTVYDERPAVCGGFPHTVRGEGSIASRMWQLIDRACYCPIVYNTLEALKGETGFRR